MKIKFVIFFSILFMSCNAYGFTLDISCSDLEYMQVVKNFEAFPFDNELCQGVCYYFIIKLTPESIDRINSALLANENNEKVDYHGMPAILIPEYKLYFNNILWYEVDPAIFFSPKQLSELFVDSQFYTTYEEALNRAMSFCPQKIILYNPELPNWLAHPAE